MVRCAAHGVVLQPEEIVGKYRIYRCPYCGWEDVVEITEEDENTEEKEENKNVDYE